MEGVGSLASMPVPPESPSADLLSAAAAAHCASVEISRDGFSEDRRHLPDLLVERWSLTSGSLVGASGMRFPRKKRQLDPLRVPELIRPATSPYTDRLPSRPGTSSSVSSRKSPPRLAPRRKMDWCSAHHVCHSKDNRNRPMLQRTYFDDLPHSRPHDNHVLPVHRSLNFDCFSHAPTHVQCAELEKRFQKYPFVEVLRERRSGGCLSSGVSIELPVDQQGGSDAWPAISVEASSTEVKAAADCDGISSERKGGISMYVSEVPSLFSPQESPYTTLEELPPIDGSLLTAPAPAVKPSSAPATPNSARQRSFCASMPVASVSSLAAFSSTSRGTMMTTRGSISSNSPRIGRKKSLFTSRSKDLNAWSQKFGGMVRLWRCIDVHGNMRVSQVQFLRCLMDLGFAGDARELFQTLNQDQTGTLLFHHFAPRAAQRVAELMQWVRGSGQTLTKLLASAVGHGVHCNENQLVNLLKQRGFQNEAAIRDVFEIVDRNSDETISSSDTQVLDKWDFPEWLTAVPDEIAAEGVKELLIELCDGHVLRTWRHFDRQATLRIAWHEFRQACRKLLPPEELEKLPSVWRAWDDDLSGWLTLQEYDSAAAADLIELCTWVQGTFGNFMAVFPKMQQAPDYRISPSEFRNTFRPSGLSDAALLDIFAGVDLDAHNSIGAAEIRVLDTWRNANQLMQAKAASVKKPAACAEGWSPELRGFHSESELGPSKPKAADDDRRRRSAI